jgi:hypothetical protein
MAPSSDHAQRGAGQTVIEARTSYCSVYFRLHGRVRPHSATLAAWRWCRLCTHGQWAKGHAALQPPGNRRHNNIPDGAAAEQRQQGDRSVLPPHVLMPLMFMYTRPCYVLGSHISGSFFCRSVAVDVPGAASGIYRNVHLGVFPDR